MAEPQHYVFALVEEFTHLAFSCAIEPLRIANLVSQCELYQWSLASENGCSVIASNGLKTLTQHRFDGLPACDRIFVISGLNLRQKSLGSLITALRRARANGASIGAICSGAYVLAKAGLLEGMRAAVHWEYHDGFREEFPEVDLVENVFVCDEKFVTASGGTAAADLLLHLIERDHGYDLAVAVADQMVYNAVRNSEAAQRVSIQSRSGIRNANLIQAIETMRANLHEPVSPSQIAEKLGISTRQLERLFERYLGTSPKKYFMQMRIERAHHLLLQTEQGITDVALACGFSDPGHFGRVYRGTFGVSPARQRARGSEGLGRNRTSHMQMLADRARYGI